VAQLAGYRIDELAQLPPDLAQSSFGCGNPLAFSEVQPDQVVLDLGSGAGLDLMLAAQRVGPGGRVIGVDMTDEMITKAAETIRLAGVTNVELRQGIIEALPVEDSSVDWVISNCVINLSPDKPKVFAEIARVLRPGGRMLVSDIVVEELPGWMRQSAQLYSSCIAGAINEPEYLDGLRAAGLEDVEVRERLVYDASQLRAFVDSELQGVEASCCGGTACCGETALSKEMIERVLGEIAGKIWSAKIFGRKAC
jgi:SAM-dependent methyltransferase